MVEQMQCAHADKCTERSCHHKRNHMENSACSTCCIMGEGTICVPAATKEKSVVDPLRKKIKEFIEQQEQSIQRYSDKITEAKYTIDALQLSNAELRIILKEDISHGKDQGC